ncbi:Mbd4 [Scenedesmus sp. PABB004]|nr:Mbd4 [Scenedesmus sp. PABB004]
MAIGLCDLPRECALAVVGRLSVVDALAVGACCSGAHGPRLSAPVPPAAAVASLRPPPRTPARTAPPAPAALRAVVADDGLWRALAEAKWGPAVHELKPLADAALAERGGAAPGWQAYCCARLELRSIPQSPLSLLQERYADPWQHIVCCVLCARTSGSALIRASVAAFFDALPTPSAVLAAPDAAVMSLLQPLGLQATRLAAVRAVSRDFLATAWAEPSEFRGCGKFVADSWRIFCRGARDARGVEDAKLRQYLAWANRAAADPDRDQAPTAPPAAAGRARKRAGSGRDQQARAGEAKRPRVQTRAAAAAAADVDAPARGAGAGGKAAAAGGKAAAAGGKGRAGAAARGRGRTRAAAVAGGRAAAR